MAKYFWEPTDHIEVPEKEAFDYAAERCGIVMTDPDAESAAEFREMLVEWFFSGNWIERNDEIEED